MMSIKETKELYATMRTIRDELPDGMWAEVQDAMADSRVDGKVDWEGFEESIREISFEWGFSIE